MKSAILLHLHYQDLWPEFREKITPILSKDVHLYVTLNTLESDYIGDIRDIATDVFLVQNKGLDVGPFIYAYNKIKSKQYRNFTKLHSKKSLHSPGGDEWRKNLYYPIVENYEFISQYVESLDKSFLLGTSAHCFDMAFEPRDHPNRLAAEFFINKACGFLGIKDEGSFIAGTMFMVNDLYLQQLFGHVDLELLYSEFEEGYSRDSLAHGMERALGYGIEHYKGMYITI